MGSTVQLRPGNMESTTFLSDGKPSDFGSSMAEAIEDALSTLMSSDGMNTFEKNTNSSDARDRRRILIAIAQGVIRHLVDNAGAFQITGTDSVNGAIQASLNIAADATLLPAVPEGS
jgi:hypothetical protein